MKTTNKILVVALICATTSFPPFGGIKGGFSQNVGINYTGASPNSTALLDIDIGTGTARGLLIPRMTAAQRDGIASPARGLMVFVTTDSAFYYNNGAPTAPSWVRFMAGSGSSGGWSLTGNTGTDSSTNFLGTTDAQPLRIMTNNTQRMIVSSNGNIGIGTTSPNNKLHLRATSAFDANILVDNTAVDSDANIRLKNDNRQWQIGVRGSGGTLDLLIIRDSNADADRLTVDTTGNVGIGTTSPIGVLSVEKSNYNDTLLYISNDANAAKDSVLVMLQNGNVGIGTSTPGQLLTLGTLEGTRLEIAKVSANLPWATSGILNPGAFVINQQSAGSTTPGADFALMRDRKKRIVSGDADTYISSQENGDILFSANLEETGGLEIARMKASGNVGIGTTSPIGVLSVEKSNINDTLLYISNDLDATKDSTMVMLQNGSVGIGTTALGAKLHLSGSGETGLIVERTAVGTEGRWTIKCEADGRLHIRDGISVVDRFDITRSGDIWLNPVSGNVGIGTTSPGAKLHIRGGAIMTEPTGDAEISINSQATNNPYIRMGIINTAGTPYGRIWTGDAIAWRSLVLQPVGGNVGIGTTVPEATLHVGSGALSALTGGTFPAFAVATADGFSIGDGGMAALINTTAAAVGNNYNKDKGGSLIFGGRYNSANANTASWAKIYGAKENATDANYSGYLAFLTRVIGSGLSESMRITSGGNVSIGTTTPGGQFELSLDQGRKPSTSTWTIVSDERLKNVQGTYQKGLKEVLQLNPITYYYKNDGERAFKEEVLSTLNMGFSAQEVQKIFPEAVGTDPDGYLNFNMHAILVAYTNAIKEQQQTIGSLQEILRKAQDDTASLKGEVAEIKALLGALTKK